MLIVVMPNFGTLAAEAQQVIQQQQAECIRLLATDLVSLVGQSYVAKARHGTGDDGIQWPELTRATIAARVRKRGEGKRIVLRRKQLADQIHALRGEKARPRLTERQRKINKAKRYEASRFQPKKVRRDGPNKLTRDVLSQRKRSANKRLIVALKKQPRGTGKTEQIRKLRLQRAELLEKLESLIDAAMANHEIGTDTGLQRASIQEAFKTATVTQHGNTAEITVGYWRQYSAAFDVKRPLIPEPIPNHWQERLERKAERWGGDLLQGVFAK